MSYATALEKVLLEDGVELSTMMGTPCLRYLGDFMAMMFDKENALIIKVSPERVNNLIAEGTGKEFNFTNSGFTQVGAYELVRLDHLVVLRPRQTVRSVEELHVEAGVDIKLNDIEINDILNHAGAELELAKVFSQ